MINSESNSFDRYLEPSWCLQANVIVAIYAGVGLCGTLGVRGGVQLDMNGIYNHTIQLLYPSIRKTGAYLNLSVRIWVDALLFSIPIPVANLVEKRYGYYEDIANSDIIGGSKTSSSEAQTQTSAVDEDTGVVMRPRSANQSAWLPNGNVDVASTFEEASSTVLLENGYDRADPQLMDLGGGRILLVFIADDPSRSDNDRTALMYSIYENGTWSNPTKIQDDGTADFEPDLCDAGDKVLISWTSRSEGVPSENELDYIKSMDVYAVTLDKATLELGTTEQLTNDTEKGMYDSAPVGLYDETTGDMMVYYLKSEVKGTDFEKSVMPTTNESVIVYMLYDASMGKWLRDYYYPNEVASDEAEQELIENWGGQRFLASPIKDFSKNSPVIIDFDAISYNGIGLYTFTVDQDNNMDTDSDRELFVQAYDFDTHTTYVPVRITNDNFADARPQLVRNGEYTYLFWFENNKDIRYINVTDLIKYGVNADGTIKEDYDFNINVVFFMDSSDSTSIVNPSFDSYNAFVDKDNNLFVTWLQPAKEEDGSSCQEIYASAFIRDAEGSCWSDGVRLTHSGVQNDEVAFLTDESGNLLTVSNQYKVDFVDEKLGAKDIKLVATNYKTVGSINVTDVQLADTSPTAGSENNVTITVKNTGLKNAKGYTMDVYEKVNGEVGEKLTTITSDEILTPSSSDTAELVWTMPESYEGVDDLSLYITVNETETSEISEFTSDSIDIRAEYEIVSYDIFESSDGFYITYTVKNIGNKDSEADDEQSADKFMVEFNDIHYTYAETAPYLETPISALAIGETQTYTMPLSIPDERFEFGYSEAYMRVVDKDGNALSKKEPFQIMLEYPYNIVINNDAQLKEIVLKEGESLKLSAEYSPKEYYVGGEINYSVDDTSIASVDGNTLIAENAGETELTAIVDPYGGSKTVKVTVKENKPSRPSSGGSGGSGSSGSSAAPQSTATAAPSATEAPSVTENTEWNKFIDVTPTDWFYDSVKYIFDKGYFFGVSDDAFEPQTNITRGMFATVLGRMSGVTEESTDTEFEDVDKDMYYAPYISWAVKNGIVLGYEDGKFGPDDLITREQAAAMMWRYAQYTGADVSVGEDTNILSYTDAPQISEYAIPALQWACGADVINGYTDNTLLPQNNATRAEAAAMIERLDKILNNDNNIQ